MKFAKELEHDAVPEWRIKYLNYKAGKKYIKALSRAINRANATPKSFERRNTPRSYMTPRSARDGTPAHVGASPGKQDDPAQPSAQTSRAIKHSPAMRIPPSAEGQALTGKGKLMSYGSFIPTPPTDSPIARYDSRQNFELPGPAMEGADPANPADAKKKHPGQSSMQRSTTMHSVPSLSGADTSKFRSQPDMHGSPGAVHKSPSQLRRLLSHTATMGPMGQSRSDIRLQNSPGFDLVREREREFYEFLDSELDKVESFYRLKEEQAGARLAVLREQLHEMRNRRIKEMAVDLRRDDRHAHESGDESKQDRFNGWVQPFKAMVFPPGPNSKALSTMPHTPFLAGHGSNGDASRDYTRRPQNHEVSYRTAKRKLKLALQEFYRGLELLKSYAMLNRTAFRKLNKKYDKTITARPPYRYVNEKVHKSWFVTSDVLEGHIHAVEDLYARYFERGNHKLAAGKLRSLTNKPTDESGSSFLNGFLLGIGVVFAVQGLIYGSELLFHDDLVIRVQTSYLMQIYAGYFFMLILFSFFCIDCYIWSKNKINYTFIFEFDQRHPLDWRRMAEFPSFFLLLFGVFLWANFSRFGDGQFYLYYPVVLIGITVAIILMPAPIFAHKARKWFAYAHWRLLLSGLYPVEFRDFFLGDMYCSLTYATANIELFFCLYAHRWNDPPQCNSNHSRLLGFLATLPAIWRFLQCIRRYKDTRNIFPHLVNCGKYGMTILFYVTLSLLRIQETDGHLSLFVTFAVLYAIYVSIWDLFMDFSLLQTHSRHYGLRDILALKRRWPYYAIMVVDPILRFAWIFYAIFAHDSQHSTIVAFLVSLAEVIRRGMWALFRVENEHCANVSQYKASRDVPLPYRIEPLMSHASAESSPTMLPSDPAQQAQGGGGVAQHPDPESALGSSTAVSSSFGLARRRTDAADSPRTFSRILAEAHRQDFEKKRKPQDPAAEDEHDAHSDDDDEDGEEAEEASVVAEAEDLRRRGEDSD